MYLVNGELSERLALNDRGIQFGDGCFTTARLVAGNVVLLTYHLARLQHACNRLAIPFNGTAWPKKWGDWRSNIPTGC